MNLHTENINCGSVDSGK